MKKYFPGIAIVLLTITITSFQDFNEWQLLKEKLMTPWGEKINPFDVFPEYPRPMLRRDEWMNLNGLWKYSILPAGSTVPSAFEGEILVPFSAETALSGVRKKVGENNVLWYSRNFSIPGKWKKRRIRLNFCASDWKTTSKNVIVYSSDTKVLFNSQV